jgi:hypothetical protein
MNKTAGQSEDYFQKYVNQQFKANSAAALNRIAHFIIVHLKIKVCVVIFKKSELAGKYGFSEDYRDTAGYPGRQSTAASS